MLALTVTLLLLLLGLALVIFGGDLFVRAAVGIAEHLRLPHVVIGGTLMSVATTSPEIAVSVVSGIKNQPGLAIGNAVGSILCNIGLIAGLMIVLRPVAVHANLYVVPFTTLIGLSALALLMALNGVIGRPEAGVLLAAGVVYFVVDLIRHLRSRSPRAEAEAAALEAQVAPKTQSLSLIFGLFGLGAAMVIGGSHLLVDNAVTLAIRIGVSPLVIGLTIVAVGTSLPELVTALASARRGVVELSLGNILGANVANWTLVAGSAGLFHPITLGRTDFALNFPALFIIIGLLGYLLLVRRHLARSAGIALLTLYALYIVVLCWVSLAAAQPG